MFGRVRFADEHAVHVTAKRRDGPGAPRFEDPDAAREAPGAVDETLFDPVRKGALYGLVDELLVAPHDGLGSDDVGAEENAKAERFKALRHKVRRFEFGPAFFGTAVNASAGFDEFANDFLIGEHE